jgi:hypothetical protein
MAHITDFMLLDLCTQEEAVHRFTHNWSPTEILEWISYFGRLVWSEQYAEFIHYPNPYNLRSAFYFTENDSLHIFRIRGLLLNTEDRFLNIERNRALLAEWRSASWRGWAFCETKTWIGY